MPYEYEYITYEEEEHVSMIRINTFAKDPREKRSLSHELDEICSRIASDNNIRVVAITGCFNNAFSLGEDLISNVLGAEREIEIEPCSLAETISKVTQPVIAGISGDAVGPGLEMALACDIRISTETSYFGLPQIRRGGLPMDGGTQRLSRLVGKGKALQMILTGEMIDAQEAFRIGLVNRLVPPLELLDSLSAMAHKMATKSPIAMKYAKEAIHDGMDLTLGQALRFEADLYFLLHTTGDRREGIRAFQEKRSPHFRGK